MTEFVQTLSEAQALLDAHRRASREYAGRFMRECPSSLVDAALRHGFGRSLLDIVTGLFRERLRQGRPLPTMAEMVKFRLPARDYDWYSRYGQPLPRHVADNIAASRRQRAATRRDDGPGWVPKGAEAGP